MVHLTWKMVFFPHIIRKKSHFLRWKPLFGQNNFCQMTFFRVIWLFPFSFGKKIHFSCKMTFALGSCYTEEKRKVILQEKWIFCQKHEKSHIIRKDKNHFIRITLNQCWYLFFDDKKRFKAVVAVWFVPSNEIRGSSA